MARSLALLLTMISQFPACEQAADGVQRSANPAVSITRDRVYFGCHIVCGCCATLHNIARDQCDDEGDLARLACAYSSRSLKRRIFPVAVFGSSGRNSIQRGYLCGASSALTCCLSCS